MLRYYAVFLLLFIFYGYHCMCTWYTNAWMWVRWDHKATLALRPFSYLLYIPIFFILPVIPYLVWSTVSYIMESHHICLIPWYVYLSDEISIQLKSHTHIGYVRLFVALFTNWAVSYFRCEEASVQLPFAVNRHVCNDFFTNSRTYIF
jgi:hypothetical protein